MTTKNAIKAVRQIILDNREKRGIGRHSKAEQNCRFEPLGSRCRTQTKKAEEIRLSEQRSVPNRCWPGVNHLLTLVRLNVLDSALRAPVVAATTPDISPFFSIFGTAIVIDELSFRHHYPPHLKLVSLFPARHSP